ncbi:hypothetical protein [Shouchella hunanensis]|uniref:CdiI immunity protein domain-containing protein n=1 Tax=Shouchella hunanensis TaxID=766894 RepID=A0ABY7W1R2_9BACI|nr:hypothetical protein [Shouchella hunanensis]WDF02379.1 hypothetical protein PQ477_12690 [Shouchella hunanensis]
MKFFQNGWQGVYLQKIRLLLEQAIQGDITHLELSDECEKILFTEEHLTDKVRDLLETITMQWDLYITNTIDSDRLTEGIDLSHLSLPRNWLDGWLEEVKRVEETLENL